VPVPPVHVHNEHCSQRNEKFEPTVLGTPTVFKVENTLPLFVCFINQWQVLVEEMCKLKMIYLFENNISKVVFGGQILIAMELC
jgi:hypothetical protein